MNKYRISGYVSGIGACQVDLEANNAKEARMFAINNHDYYKIIYISTLPIDHKFYNTYKDENKEIEK